MIKIKRSYEPVDFIDWVSANELTLEFTFHNGEYTCSFSEGHVFSQDLTLQVGEGYCELAALMKFVKNASGRRFEFSSQKEENFLEIPVFLDNDHKLVRFLENN